MKSIMLSIRPEWVEKILNGEKTIEIRKTMPKCDLPVRVYIYCTKNSPYLMDLRTYNYLPYNYDLIYYSGAKFDENAINGKVVAEFILKEVDTLVCHQEGRFDTWNFKDKDALDKCLKDSCLSMEEIVDYIGDSKDAYAWHISDLKIYDKPKELSGFRNGAYCSNYMNNVRVTKNAVFDYVAHYEESFICRKCKYFNGDFNTCDKTVQPLTRPPQSWCYVEEYGGNDE